jgi:hypothetical protein
MSKFLLTIVVLIGGTYLTGWYLTMPSKPPCDYKVKFIARYGDIPDVQFICKETK